MDYMLFAVILCFCMHSLHAGVYHNRGYSHPWDNNNGCCRQPGWDIKDCSCCNLNQVPWFDTRETLMTLNLNENRIRTIKTHAFADLTELGHLLLRNNKLQDINERSFEGLGNLQTLDLIQKHGFEIPTHTFKPLTSLKKLKLGELCRGPLCKFPTDVFPDVSRNLEFLELSAPQNLVFGREFAHFQWLETLVLRGQECVLGSVTRETFNVFNASLRTLQVHSCKVTDLDADSFQGLQKLETLNFACNKNLNITKIFDVIKQMPNPSLKTLIIDGVLSGVGLNALKGDWFDSPKFENLRRLSLRQTNIISIDLGFLFHIPKIDTINFGYNTILNTSYKGDYKVLFSQMGRMNITSLDISHMNSRIGASQVFRDTFCHVDELQSEEFFRKPPAYVNFTYQIPATNHRTITVEPGNLTDMIIKNIPQSLFYIYAAEMNAFEFETLTTNSDNNVLFIDYSGRRIKEIQGVWKGFSKLQGLDLSNNELQSINPQFFDNLPSLTHLDLSNNDFTDLDLKRLFRSSKNIRTLYLSDNRIENIQEDALDGLHSLEHLKLHNNDLQSVKLNLKNNKRLRSLDLRWTRLHVNQQFMDQLDRHQKSFGSQFELKLSGNIFQCDCDNVNFLKWLKRTHVDVVNRYYLQCHYTDMIWNITDVRKTVEDSCPQNNVSFWLSIACGVSLAVVVIAVLIHFSWVNIKLRCKMLRLVMNYKWKLDNAPPSVLFDENAKYHAFVSLNREDHHWVMGTLVLQVEANWGFKLCIGLRDFLPGTYVIDGISEAIQKSEYVIVVVTPSALTDNWCDFSMRLAMAKDLSKLVIIYKDEVDPEKMTNTLKSFIDSPHCIRYSYTPEGNADFWNKLRNKLCGGEMESKV